ncbi:MAG: exodeoxyribonuclease III [Betaproteobacteria bacterium]|jgi:exodeoxyribonuclease-3|nr:exodeoxyribonuclease III [Betaproteobacteria bacterium]
MLRIITLNLNGIRSAGRKGFFDWLQMQNADVVCLQELKAQVGDMTRDFLNPGGFFGYFHYAEKKGYSGVGLYSRRQPEQVIEGFGVDEFDAEGRYIEAVFGKLSVVSVYLPSGSSSPERQAAKFRFLEHFRPHLEQLRRAGREVLLCGDWNIAHREIDLKNWKGNQKNSGFLPEERAWIGEVFDQAGFVDVYRRLHPDTEGDAYTWWSNRGQARAKNVGWRIDYQIATPDLAAAARHASVYKEKWFSDHAPLTIDYDYESG